MEQSFAVHRNAVHRLITINKPGAASAGGATRESPATPRRGGATGDPPRRDQRRFYGLAAAAAVILMVSFLGQLPTSADWSDFAFWDPGSVLKANLLLARGFKPGIDFGYTHGLASLAVQSWGFAWLGRTAAAYLILTAGMELLMALAVARLAVAFDLTGPATLFLLAALPLAIVPCYPTLTHPLQALLLLWALAAQAQGRRSWALALMTAGVLVQPSMPYVYGFILVLWTLRAWWREDLHPGPARAQPQRGRHRRSTLALFQRTWAALATGVALAALLVWRFGGASLAATILPISGARTYRDYGFGFLSDGLRQFLFPAKAPWLYYLFTPAGLWGIMSLLVAAAMAATIVSFLVGRGTGHGGFSILSLVSRGKTMARTFGTGESAQLATDNVDLPEAPGASTMTFGGGPTRASALREMPGAPGVSTTTFGSLDARGETFLSLGAMHLLFALGFYGWRDSWQSYAYLPVVFTAVLISATGAGARSPLKAPPAIPPSSPHPRRGDAGGNGRLVQGPPPRRVISRIGLGAALVLCVLAVLSQTSNFHRAWSGWQTKVRTRQTGYLWANRKQLVQWQQAIAVTQGRPTLALVFGYPPWRPPGMALPESWYPVAGIPTRRETARLKRQILRHRYILIWRLFRPHDPWHSAGFAPIRRRFTRIFQSRYFAVWRRRRLAVPPPLSTRARPAAGRREVVVVYGCPATQYRLHIAANGA